MTTAQKNTIAQVMKAAWNLYRAGSIKTKTYFASCLKQAWKEAKTPAAPAIEVIEMSSNKKASRPATYEQYKYLRDLGVELPLVSRFTKYFNTWEASEAINLAKAGKKVEMYA